MSEFTPGPWRWEINLHSKSLHLVGGRPQYDLTVIDFERWGMSRATMRLRDTVNIMHRLHDRADWIAPFAGREHHVDWCANVTHPDARLIAAAPDLLAALEYVYSYRGEVPTHIADVCSIAIAAAKGKA